MKVNFIGYTEGLDPTIFDSLGRFFKAINDPEVILEVKDVSDLYYLRATLCFGGFRISCSLLHEDRLAAANLLVKLLADKLLKHGNELAAYLPDSLNVKSRSQKSDLLLCKEVNLEPPVYSDEEALLVLKLGDEPALVYQHKESGELRLIIRTELGYELKSYTCKINGI